MSTIEKSGTGIERSGTGIERSGTGIERSGTGIERSGNECKLRTALFCSMFIGGLITSQAAFSDQARLLVTSSDQNLLVSLHASEGVITGATPSSWGDGYYLVPLFSAIRVIQEPSLEPLVLGSGSGAASEVLGSGSGASKEVLGSGSGAATQVLGSGSGGAPQVLGSGSGAATQVLGSGSGGTPQTCHLGAMTLVLGSGSGSATEVLGSGSGSVKEVLGSGSGGSKEVLGSGSGGIGEVLGSGSGGTTLVLGSGSGGSSLALGDCSIQPWGYAEIVSDRDGMHVLIHKQGAFGLDEHLVGFVPAPTTNQAGNGGFLPTDGTWTHDFLAKP